MTDAQVAAYLAKYASKSAEVTGHVSNRLTGDTIDNYADATGTYTERLVDACWVLGTPGTGGGCAHTVTLNTQVHEWPDVLDRTRLLIDGALGQHETATTPAGSRA